MTLIADSGAIYALYDADDAHHASVSKTVENERGAPTARYPYFFATISSKSGIIRLPSIYQVRGSDSLFYGS